MKGQQTPLWLGLAVVAGLGLVWWLDQSDSSSIDDFSDAGSGDEGSGGSAPELPAPIDAAGDIDYSEAGSMDMSNPVGPRGIRNNNPGNIRRVPPQPWQGLGGTQTDPDFYQFVSAAYGIRALAKTLLTYQDSYGLLTLAGMISRWAPPSENNTPAYIAAVSAQVGIDPNTSLFLRSNLPALTALVAAIITHENGVQPYDAATLGQGISLALSS